MSSSLSTPPTSQPNAPTRTSPRKRPRTDTINLPAHKLPPALPKTSNFFFKGIHPKFIRRVDRADHEMMWVTCGVPGCKDFKERKVKRRIDGTNAYKSHYQSYHKGIPTSQDEENAMNALGKKTTFHLPKPLTTGEANSQFHMAYRQRLLAFIVKNNLPFRLVAQAEFNDLIKHLNPMVHAISPTTLCRDLESEFERGRDMLKAELQGHVRNSGRVSLTTDCWTAGNYKEFAAVTAHWINTDWERRSTILDIIELENPVHCGLYLAEELVKVTDTFDITKSVISVTRDNASVNDALLTDFQRRVEKQWEEMNEEKKTQYALQFKRDEGDIGCVSHIYNLGVVNGRHIT